MQLTIVNNVGQRTLLRQGHMNVIRKGRGKASMKNGKVLAEAVKTELPMIARTIIEAPVVIVIDDMQNTIVVGIILSIGAEIVETVVS